MASRVKARRRLHVGRVADRTKGGAPTVSLIGVPVGPKTARAAPGVSGPSVGGV